MIRREEQLQINRPNMNDLKNEKDTERQQAGETEKKTRVSEGGSPWSPVPSTHRV